MRIRPSFPLALSLAAALAPAWLAAQLRLTGAVVDSAGNGIAYANVALLAAADTSLAAFASTTNDGTFTLRLDGGAAGEYLLRVSFVGYRTHEQTTAVDPGDRLLELDAVTLHPQGYLLGGIEVSGYRIPIRMRGDTVVFDADAFATGPHAVVEDLLRRLPGLSVEAGGVIRYHGRPISEVMVNGRPFFRGNTRLLTHNLNAAAVEDVEVYDRKSASETVSGEDDGREDLTVNLTIKEEAEGDLFGEVYGGLGTEARYRAGGKAFRIEGASQLGAVATANNLNETGLSYGELQSLGLVGGASGEGKTGGISPGLSRGQVLGDNRTLAGGLNYGRPFGKTANATLSYLVYDVDERMAALQTDRFADAEHGETTVARTSENRRYLHQLSADLERQLDTSSWLVARVDARLAGRQRTRSSAVDFRRGANTSAYLQREASRQRLPSADASVDYSQRFRASGLVLALDHRSSIGLDRDALDSELAGDVVDDASTAGGVLEGVFAESGALDWQTETRSHLHKGNLTLGKRLGRGWTLSPSLGYIHGRAGVANTLQDDDPDGGTSSTGESSLGFVSRYTLLQPGLRIRRRFDRGHWSLGIERHHLDWRLTGRGARAMPPHRDTTRRSQLDYWAPQAELALEPGEGRLLFSLSAQPELPRPTQLLAIADPRDVGQVQLGAPDLSPAFAYRLNGRYFLFHTFSGFSLMANGQLAHVDSPVGYALDLRGKVPVSQATNFEFLRKQNGYVRVGQRLGPLAMKAAVEGVLAREAGPGQLNGVATDYANVSWEVGGRLERATGKDGFVEVAYRYGRNASVYAAGDTRVGTSTQRLSVGGEVALPGRLRLVSTFAQQVFATADGRATRARLLLWGASLDWQVWADKPHGLRLVATDMLDQNRGVTQEALGFAVRETRASVLGRVVLLEARWRL